MPIPRPPRLPSREEGPRWSPPIPREPNESRSYREPRLPSPAPVVHVPIRDPDNPYFEPPPPRPTFSSPSPPPAAPAAPAAPVAAATSSPQPQPTPEEGNQKEQPYSFSPALQAGQLYPIYRPAREGETPTAVVGGQPVVLVGYHYVTGEGEGRQHFAVILAGEEIPHREAYTKVVEVEGPLPSTTRDVEIALGLRKKPAVPDIPQVIPLSESEAFQLQQGTLISPEYRRGNYVYDELLQGYVDPNDPTYQAWRKWGEEQGFYGSSQGRAKFQSWLKQQQQALWEEQNRPRLERRRQEEEERRRRNTLPWWQTWEVSPDMNPMNRQPFWEWVQERSS